MYHFKERIARRDGYFISRDVSRAAMVTIIEDRIARCDGCMDRYVPHGSQTERQRVVVVEVRLGWLRAWIFVVLVILFFSEASGEICEVVVCLLNEPSYFYL
uniref:Uncharacterized protein n=1 Tax=Solanum tuberosum TaxID=4113 RepID=M1CJN6_SOLTU